MESVGAHIPRTPSRANVLLVAITNNLYIPIYTYIVNSI